MRKNNRMEKGLIAKSSTSINAPISKVWGALTNPEIIKQYMFGVDTISDWQVGSSIVWKGKWQGKPFEDKGKIIKVEKERTLQYIHFSPLSGLPDTPENYHTVTINLSNDGAATLLSLSQDNNPTEEAREHSEKNWKTMLVELKKLLENHNIRTQIVEIAQFKLIAGVSDEEFIKEAEAVQKDFLEKQSGYIDRELLKDKDGQWVDIVYWESLENAKKAQEAAMGSKTCMPMFQKIDPSSIKMLHLEQVMTWK